MARLKEDVDHVYGKVTDMDAAVSVSSFVYTLLLLSLLVVPYSSRSSTNTVISRSSIVIALLWS